MNLSIWFNIASKQIVQNTIVNKKLVVVNANYGYICYVKISRKSFKLHNNRNNTKSTDGECGVCSTFFKGRQSVESENAI